MKKTLDNIQTLRGLAALSVAFLHATSPAGFGLSPSFGNFGVDIFFVISGYIISHITSVNPRKFIVKRIIRIVPFYWSATLLLFAVGVVAPKYLHSDDISLNLLVHSLLFVPYAQRGGNLEPLLKLGWTLNYEMYFYAMFYVAMQVNYKFRTLICTTLLSIVYMGIRFSTQKPLAISFYADPIIFEFVLGMLSFHVCEAIGQLGLPFRRLRTGLFVALALLTVSFALCPLLEMREINSDPTLAARLGQLGLLAFVIVTTSVIVERIYGLRFANFISRELGDASYILYLTHPYVIYGVTRVLLVHLLPVASGQTWLLVVAVLLLVSAISIAISELLEKPVIARLRKLFVPAIADPPSNPSPAGV